MRVPSVSQNVVIRLGGLDKSGYWKYVYTNRYLAEIVVQHTHKL